MTLIPINILNHLIGMHNSLALENDRRRCNPAQAVVCSQDFVSLWQTLARSAHSFPDEGYGIHAEEFDTQVGEKEHFAGHGAKDGGVGIVEIPLVVVEC